MHDKYIKMLIAKITGIYIDVDFYNDTTYHQCNE